MQRYAPAIRKVANFGPVVRSRSAFASLVKGAAQRLGPTLIPLIPARLRPFVAKIYRPPARYIAAGKYRRKYGGRFVSKIDPADDLLEWESSRIETETARPAFSYYHAVRGYLGGGEWNAHEVESVLDDAGFSLREAGSFLEFACGYGRLTRHFVHMISPSKITVSDIEPRAVDFVRKEFGVDGFNSASTAEDLAHDGRYDLIVVVSLFSHLSIQQWGPWLKRLNEMLNADGLLLFTTHNINDADEKDFQAPADGFLYREQNETRGRLDVEHYGAAYVGENYVARVVSESFGGRLLSFSPHALLLAQDAYVLQRVDEGDSEPVATGGVAKITKPSL
jgi:2-polyprenyl-3-methyl-5-hydroxy-6-metoxy-1,4-benzoquinol methylase